MPFLAKQDTERYTLTNTGNLLTYDNLDLRSYHTLCCGIQASGGQFPYHPNAASIYAAFTDGGVNHYVTQQKNGGLFPLSEQDFAPFTSLFCYNVPNELTTGDAGVPGVLFFYRNELDRICTYHFPIRKLTPVDDTVVWHNELEAADSDIRVFNTSSGPCLAIVADSKLRPGTQGLYFKLLNQAAATVAVELNCIFSIGDFEYDLSNSHVVCLNNDCIIVYYKLYEEKEGELYQATAYVSFYFKLDGVVAFSGDRIQLKPFPLVYDYIPSVGNRGIDYNPNTGRLALLLEDAEGVQRYGCTDGYGYLLQLSEPLDDPFKYPSYKKLIAHGSKQYTEVSASVGTSFYAFGYYAMGELPSTTKAYYLTFGLSVEAAQTLRRPIFNELDIANRTEILLPDGSYKVDDHKYFTYSLASSDKNGYDFENDAYEAVLATGFEELMQLKQIKATVGVNGVSSNTAPAPGITGYSREFVKRYSKITFPDTTGYLDLATLTISFWVYLEVHDPGNLNLRSILYKDKGDGTPAFAIFWHEAAQILKVSIQDVVGTKAVTFDAILPSIPLNHWYYVTLTSSGTSTELYVYGKLVGSVAMDGPVVFGAAPTDLILGDSSAYAGGYDSFKGRIDGLVIGETSITHNDLLNLFAMEIAGETGPVVTGRLLDVPSDRTTGVFQFRLTDTDLKLYSVVIRDVNFVNDNEIGLCTFLDLYYQESGEEPVYVRSWAAPELLNTAMTWPEKASIAASMGNGPTLNLQGSFNGDIGVLTLFYACTGTIEGIVHFFVFKAELFPESALLPVTWTKVMSADQDDVDINEVFAAPGSGLVVMAGELTGDEYVFFIETAVYGDAALSTCVKELFSSFVPAVAQTNTGVDLTAISTVQKMCGLVIRRVVENTGLPEALHGQYQLIYGITGTALGAGDPEDLIPSETLLMTAHVVVELDPGVAISLLTSPIQLDYYGKGGIAPFAPLRALTHIDPLHNTSDIFVLGYEGVKTFTIGKYNDGSELELCLYQANCDGIAGYQKVMNLPFTASEVQSARNYVDLAWSVYTDTDSAESLRYGLSLVRPYPAPMDACRLTYYKNGELVNLGYDAGAIPGYVSILSNYKVSLPLWTEISYELRSQSLNRGCAPRLKTGLFDAAHVTKGVLPGYTAANYDLVPNTMYMRTKKVFCYGSKGVVYTFFGDSTLHPAMTGVSANTGQNIVLGESLGTMGRAAGEVWPVGIVEKDSVVYFYYLLFQAGGFMAVRCWSAPIGTFAGSVSTAWTSPILLPVQCYENFRVILHTNEIFLYFLITNVNTSSIFYKSLVAGTPSITPALNVGSVPFKVSGRFYVVSQEYVTLYLGNCDNLVSVATYGLTHDPVNKKVFKPLFLLKEGVVPYPQCNPISSYTRTNVPFLLMYLESQHSLACSGGFSGEYGDLFKLERDTGLLPVFCIAYGHGEFVYDSVELSVKLWASLYINANSLENVVNNVNIVPCGLAQKTSNSFVLMFAILDQVVRADGPFRYHTGEETDTRNFNLLQSFVDITDPEPSVMGVVANRAGSYRLSMAELIIDTPVLTSTDLIRDIGHDFSKNDHAQLWDVAAASGAVPGDTAPKPLHDHVQGAKVLHMGSGIALQVYLMQGETP